MYLRTATVGAASAALLLTLASTRAETIEVDVGEPDDQFSKLAVAAHKGDIIDFKFHSSSHNIFETKGFSVADACTPKEGALHLPLMKDGSEYKLMINSTDPVYLACGPHCQSNGMVIVVNPPNASVPHDFQANAKMSKPEGPPSSNMSSGANNGSQSQGLGPNVPTAVYPGGWNQTQPPTYKKNGASGMHSGASSGSMATAAMSLASIVLIAYWSVI